MALPASLAYVSPLLDVLVEMALEDVRRGITCENADESEQQPHHHRPNLENTMSTNDPSTLDTVAPIPPDNLFDWRLPSGKKLGDATRSEIIEAAAYYRSLAGQRTVKRNRKSGSNSKV